MSDAPILDDMSLSAAQRRFLAFHVELPLPHRWAWLDSDNGPPEKWQTLRAWKAGAGGDRHATITRAELADLSRRGLMDSFVVSEKGKEAALWAAP